MESSSQCMQDVWVRTLHPAPGRFLDIGCGAAEYISDTFTLEKEGWHGTCIDLQEQDFTNRQCEYIVADAISHISRNLFNQHFCYVSFDIDEGTADAVKAFLDNGNSFTVATVEHDKYLHGPMLQIEQQAILKAKGYVPMFVDIFPNTMPTLVFEDWWVSPNIFDRTLANGLSDKDAVRMSQEIDKRGLETACSGAGLHTSLLTQTR